MLELKEALAKLDVQKPKTREPLRVYGLRSSQPGAGPRYDTLDEALHDDRLEVTEINEGGSVPQLKVANRGDTMVFIMAGEELIGAKQNRVLNVSIMVDSKSEQPIPVSCVEAGRWAYRSPGFGSGGTTSHSFLRSLMAKHMHKAYASTGTPHSDQHEVWDEVASKIQRMQSSSPSSELHQVYRDRAKELDAILGGLAAPQDCNGAVFVSGNRILGLDLFDRPETLQKLWPKLLRGYAIDALEDTGRDVTVDEAEVREWLTSLSQAKVERFKSPGVGDDVRVESRHVHGGALLVEDHPVHVELFCEPAEKA